MSYMYLLLIFTLFVVSFILGLYISKSILHPINLTLLVWFLVISCSIFVFNKFNWSGHGILWILLYFISMECGAIIVKGRKKTINKTNQGNYIITKPTVLYFNWVIVYLIIVLGIIAFLLQLKLAGFNIKSFMDFNSFINMNSAVAYNRYYGTQNTNFLSQFLLLFIYLSALIGGYSYNFSKKLNQRIISTIGSFIPIIGIMLFSNTKAGFIACVILWLTGWCISYLLLKKRFPILNFKQIIFSIIMVLVFFAILYLVMLLRTGNFSKTFQKIIINKFSIYALGQTLNFDYWFMNYSNNISFDLGINTYMSFFKNLGLITREQGVYNILISGFGNVFSSFRGIIMDYGIIGGIIFAFINGVIIEYCINMIIGLQRKKYLYLTILSACYFFNIYGLIISPWIYTSYVLTIFGFFIFLLLVHKLINFRS